MNNPCSVELFQVPITASIEDIDGADLDVFFALAIVNPYGPTLTFVATVGKPKHGISIPLVKVLLNPFTQVVEQVGRFHVGDTWSPLSDFEPLFELDYGDCPSLILVSNKISNDTRHQIFSSIYDRFNQVAKNVWCRIGRHYGDPWTRVAESLSENNPDEDSIEIEEAISQLSGAMSSPEHVQPEIQALLSAWRGSIEYSGISDALKSKAYDIDKFKALFFDSILPTVWLPESHVSTKSEPEIHRPERLKVDSLEDIDRILESAVWRKYDEQRLVDLLRVLFLCYGKYANTEYVEKISIVYRYGLEEKIGEDSRLLLENEMVTLTESGNVLPVVFLPFLVLDENLAISTKAAIDFVSSSDYVDGQLYAFSELRNLFVGSLLANRSAVFGALVAMGDSEVIDFLTELRPLLTADEVQIAARIHTQFPQHHAIQFWLKWAKELVNSPNHEDQRKFGSCASALILVLDHDQVGKVSLGKRNFPCHKSERAISIEREWTIDGYAEEIAAELYVVESLEDAPRLFSDVLRKWGLQPNSSLIEQFIPESRGVDTIERKLRDLNAEGGKGSAGSFLSRLFGRK